MKNVITLFCFAVLLFYCKTTNAHALWIETHTQGQLNKPQEVNIFDGEFANNEREINSNWYSDLRNFTLWLYESGEEPQRLPFAASWIGFTTYLTVD